MQAHTSQFIYSDNLIEDTGTEHLIHTHVCNMVNSCLGFDISSLKLDPAVVDNSCRRNGDTNTTDMHGTC